MKQDINSLTEQLSDLLSNFSDGAEKKASRGYESARDNVNSLMSELQSRGNAAYEAAYSLEEQLEDVIQDRPIASVGIALGIGFLLGAAWKR